MIILEAHLKVFQFSSTHDEILSFLLPKFQTPTILDFLSIPSFVNILQTLQYSSITPLESQAGN